MSAERGPERPAEIKRIPTMTDQEMEIFGKITDWQLRQYIALGIAISTCIVSPPAGALMGIEALRQTYLLAKRMDKVKAEQPFKQKGILDELDHRTKASIALTAAAAVGMIKPVAGAYMLTEVVRQFYLQAQKRHKIS